VLYITLVISSIGLKSIDLLYFLAIPPAIPYTLPYIHSSHTGQGVRKR